MRRGGGWRKRGGKSAAQWASTRSSAPLCLRTLWVEQQLLALSRREQRCNKHGNTNLRDRGQGEYI